MSLSSNIKAIKRNLTKFKKNPFYKAKFTFTKYYEEGIIKDNEVLIQCYNGTSISCNTYYLLEELCLNEEFADMKVYIVAANKVYKQMCGYVKDKNYKNVEVLILHSTEYCRKLAEVKYLINNVAFPTYFIKKEGQVYLNTWHGTPLKALGKAMTGEMHTIGNVQRNFFMCDYIIAPNKFTLDILRNDYMLNNLYKGKYLLCGYPRNHIFYDLERQQKFREELDLVGKKVVVYMPTWRGSHAVRKDKDQFIYIMHMLVELDKHVDDNTVIFMKEHNMSTFKVDFKVFEKVRAFPENLETYEFLSIADALITDYSSVMFDFANTGRKVILYAYDKEEYLRDRGMYMNFDELKFAVATNSQELIKEVNELDSFEDYSEQMHPLIEFDKVNTINSIIKLMKTGKADDLNIINGTDFGSGKENVLIFTGSLHKNGMTTALKGVMNHVDKEKYNYVLTFNRSAVAQNKNTIVELGDFDFISVMGQKNFRILEALAYFCYFRYNITTKWVENKIKKIYQREAKRVYPGIDFSYVIHYTGYERHYMQLFRFMDCVRMIYVHNNLIEEQNLKNNLHMPTIKSSYNQYDRIVVVRESLQQELVTSLDSGENRVFTAHNFNNYDVIKERAVLPVKFDKETQSTHTLEKLNKILDNMDNQIFINIARFSKEKGLDNLVTAFEQYHKENKNAYLIIIGGYGKNYAELSEQVKNSVSKENIVVIRSLSNPYSILNKSDVFVLSSHYEGLPMVIMEALILEKPVISTSIPGPKEFLEQGYGYLVEDSVEGLVQGMNEYKNTKLKGLKPFDYVEFNEKALQEFNALFEK